MPKFKVVVYRSCFWETTVEAEDEKEAGELAVEMLYENPNDLDEQASGDADVSSVEEIDDGKL